MSRWIGRKAPISKMAKAASASKHVEKYGRTPLDDGIEIASSFRESSFFRGGGGLE
jgi:hypothetical protein